MPGCKAAPQAPVDVLAQAIGEAAKRRRLEPR
jgi:hypothetical protein